MWTRPVIDLEGGAPGRCCVAAIALAGWLTRPVRNRGLWHACRWIGALMAGRGATCTVRLNEDTDFTVDLGEPYWSRMVSSYYDYEPEILHVLRSLRDEPFALIDCGANYGYWSSLVSGPAFGSARTVAVEASSNVFSALKRNQRRNGERFTALHAAIHERSDQRVLLERTRGVGGSHLVDRESGTDERRDLEEVISITVDDIAASHLNDRDLPIVLKLDVEGCEVPALRGASQVLARDCLVIYEDHGSDEAHTPSAFVIDELGLIVYSIEPAGASRRIERLADLARIKLSPKRGYNLFATARGSRFDRRLHRLVG